MRSQGGKAAGGVSPRLQSKRSKCYSQAMNYGQTPANVKLYRFIHALDAEQRERFATLAGTTVGNLRHYVTGRRIPTSEMAIKLEKAARRMGKSLPPLGRRDLNPACKTCEYARACTLKLD